MKICLHMSALIILAFCVVSIAFCVLLDFVAKGYRRDSSHTKPHSIPLSQLCWKWCGCQLEIIAQNQDFMDPATDPKLGNKNSELKKALVLEGARLPTQMYCSFGKAL